MKPLLLSETAKGCDSNFLDGQRKAEHLLLGEAPTHSTRSSTLDDMTLTYRTKRWIGLLVLLFAGMTIAMQQTAMAMRKDAPAVILGTLIPWANALPADIVAFSYDEAWHQIPIQVDERDFRELSHVYGAGTIPQAVIYGVGVFEEVYCDSGTFTGPDTNPFIDDNDEIVFMTQDAGRRAPSLDTPSQTQPGSGLEVELVDPLSGQTAYVYLFLQNGSLDPSAGRSYVSYDFRLLSGDYMATYNTAGLDETTGLRNDDRGEQLNPEDSTIRSTVYERHWSYRWTCDSLRLYGGPNLVEREDYWIAPGSCGRHIGTFNAQEGAFIANISGPVRAIRSFVGANSGPLVQVDRIYYQSREDTVIYVRVHPRSAVGMFYVDHTLDAIGMTYSNDVNPQGVIIDGMPDRLESGPICWELVAGEPGSIIRLHTTLTDIDYGYNDFTLFYEDDDNPSFALCQACLEGCPHIEALGDDHLIGASGVWITAPLPNTDPALLATQFLTMVTTAYYGPAGWTGSDAAKRQAWADVPIEVECSVWPIPTDSRL